MEAKLIETEAGLSVSGKIHFDNVLVLRREGERMIACGTQQELTVDLSEIQSSDSSGLSLLLRWLSYAKKQEKKIHFVNMPDFLNKVAEVCGISHILSGQANG